MIFIKKEKLKILMKERLKFNKSNIKVISIIGLCIFIITEVIIYAQKYYIVNNLCFTQEDKFLFVIFIIGLTFICGLTIYLTIRQKTLMGLLNQVYQAIADSENNIIKLERNTQEMILKLFDKDKK